MSVVLPPFTAHFATLAGDYDVVLSDVWGVVHNGAVASAEACDALTRFRKRGGTVVLITNAPRPGAAVARLTLDRLGVPRAAYDGIVSSGDVTHALIAARAGARVFHIGPERDRACSMGSTRRSHRWSAPTTQSVRGLSMIPSRRRRTTRS